MAASGSKLASMSSMKSGSSGSRKALADVAKHLVAARVLHRVAPPRFRCASSRSPIGRVIVRELAQAVARQLVQAAVADVPDGQPIARSAAPASARTSCRHAPATRCGLPQDLVVGQRDRFAHALRRRAERPVEPLDDDVDRDGRRNLARGVAADAVDDEKHAAIDVDVMPIFVARCADGRDRSRPRRARGWRRASSAISVIVAAHPAEKREPDDGADEAAEKHDAKRV